MTRVDIKVGFMGELSEVIRAKNDFKRRGGSYFLWRRLKTQGAAAEAKLLATRVVAKGFGCVFIMLAIRVGLNGKLLFHSPAWVFGSGLNRTEKSTSVPGAMPPGKGCLNNKA